MSTNDQLLSQSSDRRHDGGQVTCWEIKIESSGNRGQLGRLAEGSDINRSVDASGEVISLYDPCDTGQSISVTVGRSSDGADPVTIELRENGDTVVLLPGSDIALKAKRGAMYVSESPGVQPANGVPRIDRAPSLESLDIDASGPVTSFFAITSSSVYRAVDR